jgi:transcriptional regulator of arginine metabolism
MSKTQARRRAILNLLNDREIKSQKELRSALAKKGFRASQPVISRDLTALKVGKSGGTYVAVLPERVTPLEQLKPLLRGAEPASRFVVVFCEPGAGSAVARAIDQLADDGFEGLVGTVAGDDTVLVALGNDAAAQRMRRIVRELVEGV